MLKIMANENMDEWKTRLGVIDETVMAAKKFLEENPEEVRKLSRYDKTSGSTEPDLGKVIIARFLGWPDTRVYNSLDREQITGAGKLDREAVRNLPTENAARSFVAAVKQFKPTPGQQKRAADSPPWEYDDDIIMRIMMVFFPVFLSFVISSIRLTTQKAKNGNQNQSQKSFLHLSLRKSNLN